MKKHLTNGLIGILIGIIVSSIFSLVYAPESYYPLNPFSGIGQWFDQLQIHGSLVMLYCTVIWAAIGLLFSYADTLYHKEWSLLQATLTHYALTLLGFVPLATLAGWFPAQLFFYLSIILEFSLIYLVVWGISYRKNAKKVSDINQLLAKDKH
ncbi:DUF3021 domain-containing protein [Streptococcus sp. DD12]|uniref:DUF3021 domain-containing protein n=1 Tax=Streptococcus sp. DD12 TaxID=1777880 RepID=UPI00079532F2|nr:DUF3021 domain-containing protein [Streptococcus sp. DD12]KXT75719.1 hypothetical protein STRDD12_00831 [Streptococcus sp. DD12]